MAETWIISRRLIRARSELTLKAAEDSFAPEQKTAVIGFREYKLLRGRCVSGDGGLKLPACGAPLACFDNVPKGYPEGVGEVSVPQRITESK